MPVCPSCNYEYVEGITICPDCNTTLVDKDTMKKFDELSEEDWVVIYTSNYEYDVEMLIDNLESAGIAATMLSQKDHNFPAIGDLAVVKLMVKRDDMNAALNFITSVKRKEDNSEEE